MSCGFLNLPDDILLALFCSLDAKDLLSLVQTCRGLYELGSSDYVWHSIDVAFPLDIPSGKDRRLISGPDFVKPGSRACASSKVVLGSDWLITLSRAPTSALCLSLWYIGISNREYRYASLDVPYASKFAAISRKHGAEAIIAVVALDADRDNSISHVPILVNQISSPKTDGTPGEVHICESVVAVAVAQFENIFNPPTYRFIVLDIDTGNQLIISPELPEHFTHVQFRLFPHHLIIAGLKHHESLTVRTYDFSAVRAQLSMPAFCQDDADATCLLGDHLTEEETDDVPADSDYTLSDGYVSGDCPQLTSLLFHASGVSSLRYGSASVFSFPSNRDLRCPHGAMPVHVFSTPASAASDIICLGPTGRRAVWLERRWDTDSFTLMKATFFARIYSCQSMAFEESTELYILQL
ncbi:hypothetical protein CPB85DRAFT_1274611 [Mucidula mucida]|nr:hypothetical protein CPB85DRAFT_1274611 [Mucidula mucida]